MSERDAVRETLDEIIADGRWRGVRYWTPRQIADEMKREVAALSGSDVEGLMVHIREWANERDEIAAEIWEASNV